MKFDYLPIIKWKKGEQDALKNIKTDYTNFYPIIEVVEECSPEYFFKTLSECYNGPTFFDVSRLDTEYLYNFMSYIIENKIQSYPVLYIENFIENSVIDLPDIFSVRIPIPVDFEGPTFEEILDLLTPYQNHVVNLILDAGEVIDLPTANKVFESYCIVFSGNIEKLNEFDNIIICLTSFPEQLNIDSGDDMSYKRYDILIFKKIIEKFMKSDIIGKIHYSDYGVTKFTETEIDFSKMRYGILPKVKYTTKTQYIVKKGEKDRRTNIFTRSYIDISREIVNSQYYFGQHFCYGDQCIYDKANNPNATPGNSQQWVTYCANHHFTVLMEQLSNLFDF